MNARIAAALPALLLCGASWASAPVPEAADPAAGLQQGLMDFRSSQQLDSLYSDGLVLPNQPLPLSPEQREKARVLVQGMIRAQTGAGAPLRRDDRDVMNVLLFNYGLQVLEDGRVVVLDVYVPENPSGESMLAPGVPLPEGSEAITRENIGSLSKRAAAEAADRERKAGAQGAGKRQRSQLVDDLGSLPDIKP